jgi:Glycoside hydrolase family 44
VAGPCTWGWTDLNFSAADEGSDRYATHADRRAHGDTPFLAWYLGAMKRASEESGRRLLDLADVHFYPQGQADGQGVYAGKTSSKALRELRLRSTRGLWDRSYRDESWIREPVALIPRVREWIEQNYPGTGLCLGEYSWGGDDDPSGALAQAEVLGIFAREGVDYAYYWAGLKGVQRHAFQLYRNPDGRHRGFGERYLDCRSDASDRLSAFAARRDDRALTIVLVNKDLDHDAEVQLDLGRPFPSAGSVYRLPNPPGAIVGRHATWKPGDAAVSVPALSAALVVFPGFFAR